MRINKITTIICTIASIITGAILFIPNMPMVLHGVISNIFTGFVVSIVIALIGYFYERNRLIEKAASNLKSLFINMTILSKIIGDILVRIHGTVDLSVLRFGKIPSMAALNIEFIENMDLGLFDGFCKKSNIAKVYEELGNYQQKAFNVKNISSALEAQTLEYSITLLTLQNNQQRGIQPSPGDLAGIDILKNTINIKTAKLHEYETSLTIEIDSIADIFYKTAKKKEAWKSIKKNLQTQVEDLVSSKV